MFYLKCYLWVVKECQWYGEKWNKKWVYELILIRVLVEIFEIMVYYVILVSYDFYFIWDKFF